MAKSNDDRKVQQIRKIIKTVRGREERLRTDAPSRSTGIRNVYKASHDALAEIERVLSG